MEIPPSAGRVEGKTPEKGKGEGGREGRERQRKEGGGGSSKISRIIPFPLSSVLVYDNCLAQKVT